MEAGQTTPPRRVPTHRTEQVDSVHGALPTSTTATKSSTASPPPRPSPLIEFVNGMKHTPLAWLSAFLALVSLTFTTLYASQTSFVSRVGLVYSASSDAIFVLRALSEVTGLLLAVTIAAACERVQWLYIVKKDGIPLASYLALQPGTGVLGLLLLAVRKAVPGAMTRIWSIVRLVSIVLVPVLGVVIMSKSVWFPTEVAPTVIGVPPASGSPTMTTELPAGNVGTKLNFRKIGAVAAPLGFGLGSLNATVAAQLSPLTDVVFGASFTQFLLDPNHAVDITPAASRQNSCSQGIDVRGGQTCERAVFLAAGLDQVAPQVATAAEFPEADAWLVEGSQGYVLRFTEGNRNWHFDNATECRVYHTDVLTTTLGAFMMCAKNTTPNTLQASESGYLFVDAGAAGSAGLLASNMICIGISSPGWTTSLTTTFRRASIGFSRLNGTILSHAFADEPERDAPVRSWEILEAWDNFLGVGDFADDPTQQALSMVGLGSGDLLFPAMVGWFLNSISAIAVDNPAADTRGVNALQALLAIPLYWCQTGSVERLAMSSLPSSVLVDDANALNITGSAERGSQIFLVVIRNEIVVGRATLVAYVLLSAMALMLCFIALGIGSFTTRAASIPKTTSFPSLDFCTKCIVTSPDKTVTMRGPFQAIQGWKQSEENKMICKMKVELAAGGGEDGSTGDGHADQPAQPDCDVPESRTAVGGREDESTLIRKTSELHNPDTDIENSITPRRTGSSRVGTGNLYKRDSEVGLAL